MIRRARADGKCGLKVRVAAIVQEDAVSRLDKYRTRVSMFCNFAYTESWSRGAMGGCMQRIIMTCDFPQIQGGPQISAKNHLRAYLYRWETIRSFHKR
jgi:hypothetical protein